MPQNDLSRAHTKRLPNETICTHVSKNKMDLKYFLCDMTFTSVVVLIVLYLGV